MVYHPPGAAENNAGTEESIWGARPTIGIVPCSLLNLRNLMLLAYRHKMCITWNKIIGNPSKWCRGVVFQDEMS